MSTLVRGSGIILRSIKHGETSLILTVFTRDEGKLGLMAKGAKSKKKTGTSAGYEIFTEAQFVYYRKAGRDLQLLKEASIQNSHLALRDNLDLFSVGSAVIELLLRCSREDDPHSDLYDTATETLTALAAKPISPLPLLWKFEIDLFKSLGFELQHKQFSQSSLSGESLAVLSKLSTASHAFCGKLKLSPPAQSELLRFFSRYLESHLPVTGRLYSLDALQWHL